MTTPLRVLFLCTGNACRSQMAEGWARHLHADKLEAYSAGVAPAGVDPVAVQMMAEVGVDISRHRSKHVAEFDGQAFDAVVILCHYAAESCPNFPGQTRVIRRPFDDPVRLARLAESPEAALAIYRRVRDEIRDFVAGLPELLASSKPGSY
ncbi:MAG: arsenate reductase ArsC [Thermoguttaceae bacterium]|nr:arsenate reductase ArsC [Thermoguttaceae bacterium]MDW8079233.1 arsenate reductase ArsC [Thermoguttaceae bacterium]